MVKTIKLLLLGESGVGKSSLVRRFVKNDFKICEDSTIGFAYAEKRVSVMNHDIHVQVNDAAGNEKYNYCITPFVKRADGIILAYDVTRPHDSLSRISEWLDVIKDNNGGVNILIVVTKIDCKFDPADENIILEFAEQRNLEVIDTSAKTGQNVSDAFQKLASKVVECKDFSCQTDIVQLDNPKPAEKCRC